MTALRMQFVSIATVVFAGIWLNGFGRVHWFLYGTAASFFSRASRESVRG